jgi:hypothetical protein
MTPLSQPTNATRADRADKALRVYRRDSRCDFEDSLGDLLCDLMHWADANKFDFEAALFRAQSHHEAEAQDAGDGRRGQ